MLKRNHFKNATSFDNCLDTKTVSLIWLVAEACSDDGNEEHNSPEMVDDSGYTVTGMISQLQCEHDDDGTSDNFVAPVEVYKKIGR